MSPADFRRAADLFEQLRELPESQRTHALDAACVGNPELRQQVARLLEADRAADSGSFLEGRAIEAAARFVAVNPPDPPLARPAADNLAGRVPRPGARLGPYEIEGLLGKGGMGEVYRARDTQLNREVAIKVLPPALANDAQHMARFVQEAKVLASLNHPNIATVYGIEQGALVMELVEGDCLSGPLPMDEAIPIARQIAAGLEAAHERGIVHRDLKPANIMVTPSAVVKLLDFGLAKPANSSASRRPASPGESPVPAAFDTEPGMILGTAAYMAPEQARGKPADKRADIWAFGVVLYEMLTGRQLFARATVVDTLASIVKESPDLAGLPEETPPYLRRLLGRCLRKDVSTRLRDIGEARVLLEELPEDAAPPRPQRAPQRRPWLAWTIAASALIAAAVFAFLWLRSGTGEMRTMKLSAALPPGAEFSRVSLPAVSPDGRRLAFAAGNEGQWQLWIRDLDALSARPLPGTAGAFDPFWSPDSRSVAFFVPGKLKRADIRGSPPQTVCSAVDGRGGSWNGSDTIVFAPSFGAQLFRVPAAGGTPSPLTTLNESAGETSHRFPWFLPDGRHYLFTARNADPEKTALYLGDLESKDRRRLFAAASNAVYAPPGFLLFMRERTVMAQAFDARALQIAGAPFPIAEQVDYIQGSAQGQFSVSQTGVLAYYSGADSLREQLTWFDRSGKPLGSLGPPGVMQAPAVSPDGRSVVVDRLDTELGTYDLWVLDAAHGAETRFTFDPANDMFPVWSPDGSRILFSSNRTGRFGLYQKPATGAGREELLDAFEGVTVPTDWSDARFAIFSNTAAGTGTGIWALPLSGDRKPLPFLRGPSSESHGKLAPGGRWLAYDSDETGEPRVYVQAFPEPGGKWQVSDGAGSRPVWSRDGKELFYLAGDKLMAIDVNTGPRFVFGAPKVLFAIRMPPTGLFDVSRDGRFLVLKGVEPEAHAPITVVANWNADLKR